MGLEPTTFSLDSEPLPERHNGLTGAHEEDDAQAAPVPCLLGHSAPLYTPLPWPGGGTSSGAIRSRLSCPPVRWR